MEARQAVHEDRIGGCDLEHLLVHLIGTHELDPLAPELVGLAHGDPDVRIDDRSILCTFSDIGREGEMSACLGGNLLAGSDKTLFRHVLLRSAGTEVDAELCADDHEGVGDVVPGIAHERELASMQVASELLTHREDVCNHLRRVELGREAIPDRDARILGEGLDALLCESAVLDTVKHAAQDPGRILDGLLLAHLRGAGIEIGDIHAEIVAADLERAACARRCLLEEEHDVLALEVAVRLPCMLLALELCREIEEILDLFRSEIEKLQKAPAAEVHAHVFASESSYGLQCG